MRRFYQESWQGIPFSAFTHVSFFHLANSKFYASFYEELFRRCGSWECLPADWRHGKDKGAEWLAAQIRGQCALLYPEYNVHGDKEECASVTPRVLSIGRGVGYLEKALLDRMPHMELHVNEPTTAGLRWLRECIPPQRIYIGSPSTCLPSDIKYDVIYLSAVDYSIASAELAFAMRELCGQLKPGGRIICISASLLEEDSAVGRLVNAFKIGVRAVLHLFDLRRQQFWGWRRTRAEYHTLFNDAGVKDVQDGWLADGFNSYWISGEKR